ncbi:MAG: aminoacetone oxidase family FAD-binding enzyme [Candidatus Absconditabacterales bacterium]
MVYDVIIIGGGASGLFCSLFLPKELKKCILEKTDKLGSKVLLSGGERCNLTNINLDPNLHYVGQSLKSLPSLFHQFGPEDMIQYVNDHGIETQVEENGRVLLKGGKAKQLVEFLVHQSKNNDTEHLLNHEVHSINTADDNSFVVTTSAGIYTAKKVIIATGGMTYPQIGASPFAYEMAEQLGLSLSVPHGALCGIESHEDFSSLAGNTVQTKLTLYADNKAVYTSKGPLLFTHRGLSGPIIFDATLYMDQDISKYMLQCDFNLNATSKKIIQYFKLVMGDTVRDIRIKALRPITEAKVSVGGILLKDLDKNFQSKRIPGLYFIGESLDITGKTGGYNLQWAWTSAYCCALFF